MQTNTTTRGDIEADILQQVSNEIQEALLLHAPNSWPVERLDAIEQRLLDNTRMILDALSITELQSAGALQAHIAQAVAETKRLIRGGGLR